MPLSYWKYQLSPVLTICALLPRTHSVGRVCNFLGSVSQQQRFEMADQCYSSEFHSAKFRAQSFIQQTRNRTPMRHEGLWPQRRGLNPCWLPTEPAQCNLGLAPKGACLFHRKCSLRLAVFPLFPFPQAFPSPLATTILDSFFLFLPNSRNGKDFLGQNAYLLKV